MNPRIRRAFGTNNVQLDEIKRVRDGNEGHRHPTFAEHLLRVPELDYYALLKLYPSLNARDPHERTAEWERFYRSPFAERYRVGRIHKGVTKNGIILPHIHTQKWS